jgi:hypothetical protein
LTSPAEVLVVVLAGDALVVDRSQLVVVAESVLPAVVVVALLEGAGAVPFAPFVVFSPV